MNLVRSETDLAVEYNLHAGPLQEHDSGWNALPWQYSQAQLQLGCNLQANTSLRRAAATPAPHPDASKV